MARKPATRAEFTLFDVVYEDGSQRSNRRVPSGVLGGLDGDAPARAVIEEQDRLIADKSGTPCPSREKHTSIPRQKSRRSHAIAAVRVSIKLMTALVIKTAMATRQQRISAFIHEGDPPANQPLELLCEDHVGTYVIPFLCRLRSGAWQNVDTGCRIEATVIGWRALDGKRT